MTDVIETAPVDVDEPMHKLLRDSGNPHLDAAIAKWRRQVEQDPDKTISAFASSL